MINAGQGKASRWMRERNDGDSRWNEVRAPVGG